MQEMEDIVASVVAEDDESDRVAHALADLADASKAPPARGPGRGPGQVQAANDRSAPSYSDALRELGRAMVAKEKTPWSLSSILARANQDRSARPLTREMQEMEDIIASVVAEDEQDDPMEEALRRQGATQRQNRHGHTRAQGQGTSTAGSKTNRD
jgi:hypothetical protein